MFAGMLFITINYLVTKGLNQKVMAHHSTQGDKVQKANGIVMIFGNVDLMGGFLMVLVGYLSSTHVFEGRRILLVCAATFVVIIWNIIWMQFSQIEQPKNPETGQYQFQTESQFGLFDQVMFYGESSLSFMVYQMLLVSGPIDTCKQQMLRHNQRIYANLFCIMGAIKLVIQAIVFDSFMDEVVGKDFYQNRIAAIMACLLGLLMLIPIVRDEMSELIQKARNTNMMSSMQDNLVGFKQVGHNVTFQHHRESSGSNQADERESSRMMLTKMDTF